MTTPHRWADALRGRLGLGRLLPLGGARDGTWLAERAATAVLRAAASAVRGVRPGAVRLALADPDAAPPPAVPAPPGALPAGPLRIEAEFAVGAAGAAGPAGVAEPLPETARRLRAALAGAADGLGLRISAVDLRVTELLDEEPELAPDPESAPDPERATAGPDPDEDPQPLEPDDTSDEGRAAAAALAVPGVTRLRAVLGRAVVLAPPRARVEVAVGAGWDAAGVARGVRLAVAEALGAGAGGVAVVVTAVDFPQSRPFP